MKRHAPRIAPTDLRDHATDERVARVWALPEGRAVLMYSIIPCVYTGIPSLV